MNVERLQNLVKALRETKDPDKFTMARIMHRCGTPACALGQYAYRTDLQDEFYLKSKLGPQDWEASGVMLKKTDQPVWWGHPEIAKHFDLDDYCLDDLFNADGCGDAQTANAAADYVETFIEAHLKQQRLDALNEMVEISEALGLYEEKANVSR